jgi:WD40 repeat protein
VIGTARSNIAVVDTESHAVTTVVQAHWLDETWALAVHPSKTWFVTAGDEGSVRLWDGVAHKQASMIMLGSAVRSVAFSSDGATIAAGTIKGEVRPRSPPPPPPG